MADATHTVVNNHDASSRSSDGNVDSEKPVTESQIEQLHTNEKVNSHANYYEKDGLRTYGDGQDHDSEPQMSFKRMMALIGMAFLWTGSQIPVYLLGGIPPIIYADIGGLDIWVWFVLANLLALAAICPFVGSMSDLLGRRWVSLLGSALLVIAMIVAGTAPKMGQFIAGMALSGAGAGICELTALAVTSELAPTRKRGAYVGALVFTIVPFCPSVLYAQLISHYSTWRYNCLFAGIWALIGLVFTFFFYHPPPRPAEIGRTKKQILKEIDFIGGFLSITGMIIFLVGLQSGGYPYPWVSARVLAPLIIGGLLLFAVFPAWEIYGAKYPMFPSRMKSAPRTLILTLIITAISGANFFSVLMFWPTQAYNVYGHDPVQVGLRTLPIGFSILAGAVIVLVLLSVFRGNNRELMIASSIVMTAGCGALAVGRVDNMHVMWGILVVAGLGIGGIVVPASIMTTIICPDDIIATVTALTLSIRVIGGCIGYTIYYNVFVTYFTKNAVEYVGNTLVAIGVWDIQLITKGILLTSESLLDELYEIPYITGNETAWTMVVEAGQEAYAQSYKYVYYVSTAFGAISIICACFLQNIKKYMDDHVAVVM